METYEPYKIVEDNLIVPIYDGGWGENQPEAKSLSSALKDDEKNALEDAGVLDSDDEWHERVRRDLPRLFAARYLNPEEAFFILSGIIPEAASYKYDWNGRAFFSIRPDFGLQCIITNLSVRPINELERKIADHLFEWYVEIEAIYRAIKNGEILSNGKLNAPLEDWLSLFQSRNFDISHIPEEYQTDAYSLLKHENAELKRIAANSVQNIEKNTSKAEQLEQPIEEKSQKAYLHIIGALLEFINGEFPGATRHPDFTSAAALIEQIDTLELFGARKRNLEKQFALAKKLLNDL